MLPAIFKEQTHHFIRVSASPCPKWPPQCQPSKGQLRRQRESCRRWRSESTQVRRQRGGGSWRVRRLLVAQLLRP
ncbi:hypothetical protein ES319_A13G172100v1 [Gossypium barbadense]|uniref:Uncharacterized protein n=1 Tax=Gossypium barbadense TaxID=3634 RepID=A0A5J5T0K7_GOSBA|nr:hypothetical protein ES319_A13G172100v1 [Gossypium barbadense]